MSSKLTSALERECIREGKKKSPSLSISLSLSLSRAAISTDEIAREEGSELREGGGKKGEMREREEERARARERERERERETEREVFAVTPASILILPPAEITKPPLMVASY